MMTVVLIVLALLAQAVPAPSIDGRIEDGEWSAATRHSLTGGGDVYLLSRGEFLYVAVRGPKAGLASLCVASGERIRILHASAAVGTAIYAHEGATWALRSGFEWTLRDTRRGGGPDDRTRSEFLHKAGWLANASAAGSPEREFQIGVANVEAIAVTFLSTAEPLAVSYWPAAIDDDCKSERVPQGYLPERAEFRPATWHRIARAVFVR